MTLKDMKKDVDNKFKEVYRFTESKSDGYVFTTDSDISFTVHVMGEDEPWNFLVIDYHDTGEDGDAFYPDDYSSIDDMFKAMLEETKAS